MVARFSTALRTVAAAAAVVAAGAVPLRIATSCFAPFEPYPGHTSDYGVARPRAIREALPSIADRPEPVALVLGSSGVARAFVPSVFDAALAGRGKRYVSFNLGQLLFQPETALAMAKDIRRTFEAKHKRVGLAVVGIAEPDINRDAIRAARKAMPDQAFTFASPEVLVDRAHVDPLGALGDGLGLLFFGNVRPSRVGLWIEEAIEARLPACNSGLKQPPEGKEATAALASFCDELRARFPRGVPPWNPATRGGLDFGLPGTRASLERMIALQPSDVSSPPPPAVPPDPFAKAPDNVDENEVRTMIAAVREIAAVSDDVFVLRDIMNPAVLASVPPAQSAQWRAIAARIAREGGARILDFNDGSVTSADFGDRTHLNPLAAERFSALLASRLRPMVQKDHHASR
ncbi:hypothetical protein [Labilithrix luteola]|uniref:hypothetical protein n=1 Tax=Labilithrix luteola TaxID=1391654 RepID=UPI001472839D|nr:hypothetical protein [Labilithrix luteola]